MNAESASRLVFGGLIATSGATVVAYLGPLLGLPMIDPAACLAAVFSGATTDGSKEWWAGLMIHFAAGTIALPAVFALGLRRLFALSRGAFGLLFGFLIYLAMGALLLPLAGQGAFGGNSPDPLLANLAVLAGGLVYGAVLAHLSAPGGAVALPQPVCSEDRTAA